MRGGIPITARLFGILSLASRGLGTDADLRAAKSAIHLRSPAHFFSHGAGTEQRKRRRHTRAAMGGKRKHHR